MAKKVTKKTSKKETNSKVNKKTKNVSKKSVSKNIPTLKLLTDHEIANDFAIKAYKKFENIIKSVVLFGSVEKKKINPKSDIDIVILIDDLSIKWDQELIAWYREELNKLLLANPYSGSLHINTIKLSTWWEGILEGDPVILNVIRNGQVMLDHAGFINPLKHLLVQGKIKGTPEEIYQCLQRSPTHLSRSKAAELSAIEGIYWSMVDAAHGALMAAGFFPTSPEHVMVDLQEAFVDKKLLDKKYVIWYENIFKLHKKIDHREILDLKGEIIDGWQRRAEEFLAVMINLVKKLISN